MRLLRLEVWNWRGLDHAVLGDLAPDLNLVVGPNESGKSRLFEALRYALFERYKGESEEKKRLRTWGGGESPVVEVDFEVAGQVFRVHKRFLKGATVRLEGPGGPWTDEDAEERLRELWGTREAKGRKDIEQYLGLWPLLWVQQGRAGVAPHADLNADARARLSDALAAQVQEVVAGRAGQRIVERAEVERARYWAIGWKERGELALARSRQQETLAALERANLRRDQARGAADELAGLTETLARSEAKLREQRGEVERARARCAEARGREAALRSRELEAKTTHADRELWRQKAQERAQLEGDIAALAAEIVSREAERGKLDGTAERLSGEQVHAQAEVAGAEDARTDAKKARLAASVLERRAGLVQTIDDTRRALDQLGLGQERLRSIDDELHRIRTGPDEMKALRRLKDTHTRASAALAAASARVVMRAQKGLVIDGRALEKDEVREWRLDEATAIVIDGVVDIHVSPAGVELHRLRDAERDARQVLDALLGELGVEGVAEADDKARRRIELQAERKHHAALLEQQSAPGGQPLEEVLRAATAELATLPAPEPSGGSTLSGGAAQAEMEKADETLQAARASRDVLDRELARIMGEKQTAVARLSDARVRLETASSRLNGLPSEEDIRRAVERAEESWTRSEALVDALRKELARRGDLNAQIDREREERALAQLEASHQASKERAIALDATVRHMGAEGIHDEVQEAEAEVTETTRELERVSRRAAAARALSLALSSAQREVQERLVAPVREKVEPYLQGLLPGAELDMGDGWSVQGLRVKSGVEDFDALSGGAQEQVSLLVRLGLAEVLGQGNPLPIVLDDCLVNTDPERQRDMLRILYRASKRQQIVLFSCHDAAFERLGATRRYDLPARRVR